MRMRALNQIGSSIDCILCIAKMKYFLLLTCMLIVKPSRGGVLLWAEQRIEIPALKHFNNIDLLKLTEELRYPKVIVFHTELMENISHCFYNMHRAYVPSSDLDLKDIKEINTTIFNEFTEEAVLNSCSNKDESVLFLQIYPNVRSKREVDNNMKNGTPSSELLYELPKGPVLYSAETMMIYSAQPPLLKVNNNSLILGKSVNAILVKPDRSYPLKLVVTVPVTDGKITLRFRFPSHNGYWSLTAVELTNVDAKSYILNIMKKVEAPRRFSHHCFGETVFKNSTYNVELILYALQAQPDCKNNRFSDAMDCVPFVTAPILSGLFVSFMLIIGLFIGLGALGSIKSMDKFDNCKSKQLSIALAD